jgi:two-component system response regulator EvgA
MTSGATLRPHTADPRAVPIRIGIVDDHRLTREVVRKCCAETAGFEVVMEAETGAGAVEGVVGSRPDALVLDLGLPDFDGFEVVRRIRLADVNPRILVLSAYCTPYSVYRLEQMGIQGFIDKPSQSPSTLRSALAALREARPFFTTVFLETQNLRRRDPNAFDRQLTERQVRVLSLAAKDLSDRAIAELLGVEERLVETDLGVIMRKFNVQGRAELIRIADGLGFLLS